MFAFGLWDRNRQTLFLARDRLGIKPLYYAQTDDGFLAFGSELKTITVWPGFRRDIDDEAVEDYFGYGYVPEPRTIYKTALKLPPGHTLTVRRGEPIPQPREYWDVPVPAPAPDDHRGGRGGADRAPARGRAHPPHRRGPARRLPLRRRRLLSRGGDDGRNLRPARQDLLDRLRRPQVQRVRVRPPGRRALPHRPPCRDGGVGRLQPGGEARPSLRRALCRLLRHADLSGLRARAQDGDRRPLRRRRRRELRRLPALPLALVRRADAPSAAPVHPPPAVRLPRRGLSESRLGAEGLPRQDHLPGDGARHRRRLLPRRLRHGRRPARAPLQPRHSSAGSTAIGPSRSCGGTLPAAPISIR